MITLSSDFGSPYPAAMRGVILQREPDARLVDVSHEFPRQDVRATAFWLRETLPYFPPAVHLVVVDPGVGTDRRAIAIRAGEHALIAPDNGVAMPAARALAADASEDSTAAGTDDSIAVFEIDDSDAASSTFHGRDVFAPNAADCHRLGIGPYVDRADVTHVEDPVALELPTATIRDGQAIAEVVAVDDFGNVITNVPGEFLADVSSIGVDDQDVPVAETFADVPVGQWLVTVGSHGYVECDVNQGRGDDAFSLSTGDELVLERVE